MCRCVAECKGGCTCQLGPVEYRPTWGLGGGGRKGVKGGWVWCSPLACRLKLCLNVLIFLLAALARRACHVSA